MAIDRSGRVLVVDDDALIRDTLATALGDEGYAVRVAPDGRAALDTMGHWRPDVIVLDLMMPVMDGWEFLEQQSRDDALIHIPVIVVTATHPRHPLKAKAVLKKPLQFDSCFDSSKIHSGLDPNFRARIALNEILAPFRPDGI